MRGVYLEMFIVDIMLQHNMLLQN